MTTEAEMVAALDDRYTRIRRGTTADRYVRAAQVRSSQHFGMAPRICDYIAVDKHVCSPQSIIGHEIKVSRADWLTELKDPSKAEVFARHCHQWYVVVPDAGLVRPDEVPEGWGVMAFDPSGRLRVRKKSPQAAAEPMELDMLCGLLYAAQKHHR